MANPSLLLRPGHLVRIVRLCQKKTCVPYSLLYRVNELQGNSARVTRLDQHAPENPNTFLSQEYLSRGKIVGQVEVPRRFGWDDSARREYEWAKEYNPRYAKELEVKYG
jgi:hypothetical protein